MIFTSPYPDIEIPAVALTDFVFEHSAEYGDKPALIDARPVPRTRTRRSQGRSAPPPAASPRRGVVKGDVVALYAANSPDYVVAFHAVAALGAVVHDDQPGLHRRRARLPARARGGARAHRGRRASSTARARRRPARASRVYGSARRTGRRRSPQLLDGDRAAAPDDARAGPDDLVALPYSSGTTGLPKGVMLTHRNLVANILQSTAQQPVTAEDTLVGVLPLFHIYGLTVVMNAVLRNGATLVTMPRFDLEGFLAPRRRSTAPRRPTSSRRSSSRWPRARSWSASTSRA